MTAQFSAATLWSDAEIKTLVAAHKDGLTARQIRDRHLPHRSMKAIKSKLLGLGKHRVRAPKPVRGESRVDRRPAKPDPLLPALLRFGLRHDVDLGMGAPAFLAACDRHGVSL